MPAAPREANGPGCASIWSRARFWPGSAHRRSSMPNGISCACCATKAAAPPRPSSPRTLGISASALRSIWTTSCSRSEAMGLAGILVALGLLIWLSFRGWSVLLLAPAVAIVAAAFAGEPLLAHWTQTFMGSAAQFIAQFFPIFLLGALFGKLMDDSG